MPLYRIIYFSRTANCQNQENSHDQILATSRRNNEVDAISGALVAGNGFYLHCLEGRRGRVNGAFLRIARDRRHEGVELLDVQPVNERLFAAWPMLFIDLHETPPVEIRRFTADHTFDPSLMTPSMAVSFLAATANYAVNHASLSDTSSVILL
jgi:hypothetical protein